MRVSRDLYEEMIAHAIDARPEECVGLVAARDGSAVRVLRATNAARTPKMGYDIAPQELYRLTMDIEDADEDLGAIYHSHPKSEPVPSQTDINLALWPQSLYIIIGFPTDEPELRAYRIEGGAYEEVVLEVE